MWTLLGHSLVSVQHVTIQVILNDFLDPLQYCATLDKWSRSLAASPLEYCNYKFFFFSRKRTQPVAASHWPSSARSRTTHRPRAGCVNSWLFRFSASFFKKKKVIYALATFVLLLMKKFRTYNSPFLVHSQSNEWRWFKTCNNSTNLRMIYCRNFPVKQFSGQLKQNSIEQLEDEWTRTSGMRAL